MGYRIKNKTSSKQIARLKRHRRVRGKVFGTSERPRMVIFKSQKHIYAQIVDDLIGQTLLQSSTLTKDLSLKKTYGKEAAEKVGADIASKALAKKIKKVVFDVGGYRYHGRIQSLADAARKGGLVF